MTDVDTRPAATRDAAVCPPWCDGMHGPVTPDGDIHFGEIRMMNLAAHEPDVVMAGIGLRAGDTAPWIELVNHDGNAADKLTADEADRLAETLKALAAVARRNPTALNT